jgi:hypothetical protein
MTCVRIFRCRTTQLPLVIYYYNFFFCYWKRVLFLVKGRKTFGPCGADKDWVGLLLPEVESIGFLC